MPNERDRVVVTGGAGFVGSHLVDAVLAEGKATVVVVDNFKRGRPENLSAWQGNPRLSLVRADIRDQVAVGDAFRGATTVYHLAAQATVLAAARDFEYTFSTNVVGTYNVLRAAVDKGVRRVVFASSREVYGEPVGVPVDETHPLLAINLYGATKVAGEALCRAFARECGLDTRILRLANVYGERDFGRVIPRWIAEAKEGGDLTVFGGDQIIDFIWVGEVAQAMLQAAAAEVPLPPINVASGTGTKILDLAKRIIQVSGSAAELRVVPRRPIEVMRFIASTDRMSQMLGIQPATDPLSHLAGMIRAVAGAAA
jgi:UDP-glucose 4-epimerase